MIMLGRHLQHLLAPDKARVIYGKRKEYRELCRELSVLLLFGIYSDNRRWYCIHVLPHATI